LQVDYLRMELDSKPVAIALPAHYDSDASSFSPGGYRAGIPEPATSADALDEARARLLDLERVVNEQADFIEDLLAEKNRKTEQQRKAAMRAWGPEQAVGEPDTMTAGDRRTAWAPATADGGVEWLEAVFETPSDLAKVIVRQTCNPGGITKVTAVTEDRVEVPIWAGADPSKGQALADTPFAVPAGINAKRVKVYIDTSKVAGWEEIDAVQIVGRDGSAQWAKSTSASSTYAGGSSGTPEWDTRRSTIRWESALFETVGGTR
jgi:hypothetical protein